MASNAKGRSIPAPRPVPGPSGRGATGTGNGAAARNRDVPSHQQPPWKSSLDLVWSYSRSQSFYGENIGTSPSFVEHFAPPGSGTSVSSDQAGSDTGSIESDSYNYSGDEDQDNFDDGEVEFEDDYASDGSEFNSADTSDEESAAYEGDDTIASETVMPSKPQASWSGEQLPSNARKAVKKASDFRGMQSLSNLSRAALQARNDKLRTLQDDDPNSPDDRRGRRMSRASRSSFGSSRVSASGHPDEPNPSRPIALSRSTSSSGRSCSLSRSRGSRSRTRGARQPRGRRSGHRRHSSQQRDKANGSATKPQVLVGDVPPDDDGNLSPAPSQKAKTSAHFLRAAVLQRDGRSSSKDGSGDRSVAFPAGGSTFLQSWFNTLNAVMGVGILATPLAFSYAGWILGPILFLGCGLLTNYTGQVLFGILARNGHLRTYADIGSCAFGPRARGWVSTLFCLEMWTVCVALVMLFSDSVHAIFPNGPGINTYKILCLSIVLPTMFLPLKLLSPISVIGILSAFTLVAVVLVDGLLKPSAPGSLRDWDSSAVLYPDWMRLPLSLGLIMSGFSSHPVIPSLVRDMREPKRFPSMLNWAYVAATLLYVLMAAGGYAMFGRHVSDEVTKDLARTPGFPPMLNRIAVWLMVINPVSKFSLASRPICHTIEGSLGIEEPLPLPHPHPHSLAPTPDSHPSYGTVTPEAPSTAKTSDTAPRQSLQATSIKQPSTWELPSPALATATSALLPDNSRLPVEPRWHSLGRGAIQIVMAVLVTVTAIVLPGFEKTMAFLGSFLVITTCVIGPVWANLKLFGHEMSYVRFTADVALLIISAIAAIIGTTWAFLVA